MISDKRNKKISKLLSLVLRHKPETIGVELDENGWTSVKELITKCSENSMEINLEILKHVVETNSKKRFAFDEIGEKIRASQGHSIDVSLGYSSKKPPEILYHGTAEKFVDSILEHGLLKRNRQHVHLSSDLETAIIVGQRHGKPFIFNVLAGKMHENNYEFFLSDNGVWLGDHVPAKYLEKNSRTS